MRYARICVYYPNNSLRASIYRDTRIREYQGTRLMSDAKKVGRPPKPDTEKRQQIGVRTSPELKDHLEAAAGANGRSVAQEAEYRLQQSFADDKLFGSNNLKTVMLALSFQMWRIENRTGKSAITDRTTALACAIEAEGFFRNISGELAPDDEAKARSEAQAIVADLYRRVAPQE